MDGSAGRYHRITENDGRPGVVVLPLWDDHAGLVAQYRYPLEAWLWEVPRGYAEQAEAASDARRELFEETNLVADELRHLATLHPNSGLLTGTAELYLARISDRNAGQARAGDEVAEFRWWPFADLRTAIAQGDITDAFTLACVLHAALVSALPLQ